jgi:hypothetical protein
MDDWRLKSIKRLGGGLMLLAVLSAAVAWLTVARSGGPGQPASEHIQQAKVDPAGEKVPDAATAANADGEAKAGSQQPAGPAELSPDQIGYNRDIRPILSNNCFACHGKDAAARKAELRLDVRENATAVTDGSAPIVPGKPGQSEMIKRVTSDDPDMVMPPPSSHHELNDRQIRLLKKWIAQGAEYQKHWAYIAPTRPEPPEVEQADWVNNPIDRFVLAKLERKGIDPSPRADRTTLIRRLSLDLTGLPPTPQQIERFVNDDSPDAYRKLVERLLDSDAFGERMAVHWLDQVRYADSAGYHSDPAVDTWGYRDYVIRAFNENKPFDEFTREQLAGDLLKDNKTHDRIASAYNRLNKTTDEGGSQPAEYRVTYMIDRIKATSGAWMGATMGCAQCHDHKYDPYTMEDFYSFGAFFADVKQDAVYGGNKNRDPSMTFIRDKYEAEYESLKQKVDAAKQYYQLNDGERPAFAKWYGKLRGRVKDAPLKEVAWIEEKVADVGKVGSVEGGWNYVKAGDAPVHSGQIARRQSTDKDDVVQHYFDDAKQPRKVTANTVLYAWVHVDPDNPPKTVMLQFNSGGSWDHRAFWGKDKINFGGIGTDRAAHRPLGDLPKKGQWVRLEVPAKQVGLVGKKIDGIAFTQFGGTAYWDDAGLRTRKVEGVSAEVTQLAERPLDQLNQDQRVRAVRQYRKASEPEQYEAHQQKLKKLRDRLSKVRDKARARVLVTESRKDPREVRILSRGSWRNPTDQVVKPDVPDFLGDIAYKGKRADRLDLANWILSKDNPLTTRVVVNRFWRLFFGKAIVRTPGDLGTQGRWPTHPRLLDWLAVEFRESGWDVKHMVRLMVLSETYRQSSMPRPGLRDSDPNNKLLARQGRFRIAAEFIRDNALAAAGLLNREQFGPPIKPYQPDGYWQYLNFPKRTYKHDKNDDQWRRGVYMHWQRTFLHPMLKAFDAPNRGVCTAKRQRSNTPLQALVLLNDPTFVEAARTMAEHILQRPSESVSERITWAFRRATARKPEPREIQILTNLYNKHLKHYRDNPEDAKQLISVGLRDRPTAWPPAKVAAWTSVSRSILNLHETITRY